MNQHGDPGTAFFDEVREFVGRHGLFDRVERVLVGCSGGGDSTALLDVLVRGAEEWGLELAVGHVDHGWRGEESAADARFVEGLAAERGLPAFVERLGEGSEGAADEVGTEVSEVRARAARLRFFRRVGGEWGADAVALGHTADDRAETLLLNLVRGSGRTGLGALRPRRRLDGTLLLRPLLGQRRQAVRAYCEARGLEWREDVSNRMERFARVQLRRQVLPGLDERFPGVVERLASTAALVADEEEWLAGTARERLRELRAPESYPGGLALDAAALERLPRALARRVLREALRRVRGGLHGLDRGHVEAALDAVLTGPEAARDLPGVRVRREGERLRLLPLEGRRLRPPEGG